MWRELKAFFRDRYTRKIAAIMVVVVVAAVLLAIVSNWMWPVQP